MQIPLSPLPKVNCHRDPLSIPVLLKKGNVLTMNLVCISPQYLLFEENCRERFSAGKVKLGMSNHHIAHLDVPLSPL